MLRACPKDARHDGYDGRKRLDGDESGKGMKHKHTDMSTEDKMKMMEQRMSMMEDMMTNDGAHR